MILFIAPIRIPMLDIRIYYIIRELIIRIFIIHHYEFSRKIYRRKNFSR